MNTKLKILPHLALASLLAAVIGRADTIELSLSRVLEMAGTNNTELAIQVERVNQAKLDRNIAWYNWLPDVRVGGQYSAQEGLLQNTDGTTVNVDRDAYSRGLGHTGTGSGLTSSPGLSLEVDLADAFFTPRIASRKLEAARQAQSATNSQVMLKAAELYYDLVESKRMIELMEANHAFASELARVTSEFAQQGQGLLSDSEQAGVYAMILESNLTDARLAYSAAEAEMARFLAIDASVEFSLRDSAISPLGIYGSVPEFSQLMGAALSNRPELAQAEAIRAAAQEENSMRKWSPLFPKVAAYYSDNDFEGGYNGMDSVSSSRKDYSVALFWEIKGLGLTSYSDQAKQQSVYRQVQSIEEQVRADVAAEVRLAMHAVVHSQKQLSVLSEAVERARNAYSLTRERVFQNKGMPIEALQAMRLLEDAEKSMLRAAARYNLAQLRLMTVTGNVIDL